VRKVIAYELLSLDGIADDPDQFITDWDDVMDENLARVIASQDTVILGRRTYDDWAAFWPTSDIEPFASFINPVEKFVVSSTPPERSWANSHVVDGDLPGFVADLKQESGSDIGLHGSIALVQSMLALGLVDELRLVVAPALQGNGRTLFGADLRSRLTLTRHVVTPTGYLLLDYQVPRTTA
jgi:dihydrofolate reductase